MKAPVLTGCAVCPLGLEKAMRFMPPSIPVDPQPNLIVIGEGFSGVEGAHPVVLNAVQCGCEPEELTKHVVNACRDAYVRPTLERFPGLPVVSYGELAARSLLGGNRKLGKLLTDVKDVLGHNTLFTYGPSTNPRHQEHARITTACALQTPEYFPTEDRYEPEVLREIFCHDFVVLDLEMDIPPDRDGEQQDFCYPWVGAKLVWVGLRAGGVSYTWRANTEILRQLAVAAAEYDGLIVGHNVKGDLVTLAYYGVRFPKARIWDSLVFEKSRAIWPQESIGLKWLARKHFAASPYEAPVHTLWDAGYVTSQVPEKLAKSYLGGDLCYSEKLSLMQADRPEAGSSVAWMLASDYIPLVTAMEINGFAVDKAAVLEEEAKAEAEQQQILEEIQDIAESVTFNPDSPVQILKLLSADGVDLTSSAEAVMLENEHRHPLIPKILAYRHVAKLKSTYIDAYKFWMNHPAGDGCVHAQYGVQATEGGRCNCRNPNMQNPPARIRRCFVSRYPGGGLIDFDLAALEYRLIAHISQDETLVRLFQKSGYSPKKDENDIHIAAAMSTYSLPLVLALARRDEGKTLNYMSVYGGGYEKFLATSSLPDGPEAQATFRKIKNLYPAVNEWKQRVIRDLYRHRGVTNLFGRVREFPGQIDQNTEREAVNWIIQSSGHDILILMLLEVQGRLDASQMDEVLLVAELHDEGVYDAPARLLVPGKAIVDEIGGNLNPLIESAFGVKLLVPMFAECAILKSWK